MKLNHDKLATVTGVGLGVLNAAQTVLNQMAPGTTLGVRDYINIGISILMAVFGWTANKGVAGGAPE